jgi:hypothetical protein
MANIKKHCLTTLYVVLNRGQSDNYTDYVAHYCGNDQLRNYTGSVYDPQMKNEGKLDKVIDLTDQISNLFQLKNANADDLASNGKKEDPLNNQDPVGMRNGLRKMKLLAQNDNLHIALAKQDQRPMGPMDNN